MTNRTPAAGPEEARWHVLLIGIDSYLGGAPPLGGCVNDIDAVQRVLLDRIKVPAKSIRRLAAPLNDGVVRPVEVDTEPPTRLGVLAALTAISEMVRDGDRVFIYYSGHGTRRFVKTTDGRRYYREAIVPHDNIVFDAETGEEREQLVFDWELNLLLSRISRKTTRVTVVLDCCCSAGATRDLKSNGARTRFARSSTRGDMKLNARPEDIEAATHGLAFSARGNIAACMVVAACLDDESAQESLGAEGPGDDDGVLHGELTRALLHRLAQVPDAALLELPWAHIWSGVVDDVIARNGNQTPWLSSHAGRLLFCGPPVEGDLGYAVRVSGTRYSLDVGLLSGVTPGALVAIYPPLPLPRFFPPLGTPEDLQARVGMLRVVDAQRSASTAERLEGSSMIEPFPSGARGRLVEAGSSARLRVSLAPYDSSLARRIDSSKLLVALPEGGSGDVELLGRANGDRELTDDVFGPDPLRGDRTLYVIPAAALERATPRGRTDIVVALLEHYATYSAPIRMARACIDLPHCLRLRLLDCNHLTEALPSNRADIEVLEELQADKAPNYDLNAGRLDPTGTALVTMGQVYAVEVENTSDVDLFVTLFNCEGVGSVALYGSRVEVTKRSRARFWFQGTIGMPIVAVLPEPFSPSIDRLVAIGTTNRRATLDQMKTDTTFDNVARGIGMKSGAGLRALPERWTSATAVLRLTAPA